jgi:hypothetical protein
MVYRFGQRPGRRALVVGAEHVSYSAVLTLRHAGTEVVGLVTEHPRHQTFAIFDVLARFRYRFPVWTRTAVASLSGRERVQSVELLDLGTGAARSVACDTVIFTADWIPDQELAALGGIDIDPGTRGPAVDQGWRTSREGVFAAGNVLHGAETADVAALGGRAAGRAVVRYLRDGSWPTARVSVATSSPLAWIVPNAVSAETEERSGRPLLRSATILHRPTFRIEQDGRQLSSARARRSGPGRSVHMPAGWMDAVDPEGGEAIVSGFPSR